MKIPPAPLRHRLLELSEDVLSGALPRLEDVARAAGTSRARLYYYFSGTDDLRAYLLHEHVGGGAEALAAAAAGDGRAVDRLERVVAALAGFLAERPGLCGGFLGSAASTDAALDANDAGIAAPLRGLLTEAAAAGEIDPGDVADAADAVLGAVLLGVLGHTRRRAGTPADPALGAALASQVVRGLAVR